MKKEFFYYQSVFELLALTDLATLTQCLNELVSRREKPLIDKLNLKESLNRFARFEVQNDSVTVP